MKSCMSICPYHPTCLKFSNLSSYVINKFDTFTGAVIFAAFFTYCFFKYIRSRYVNTIFFHQIVFCFIKSDGSIPI